MSFRKIGEVKMLFVFSRRKGRSQCTSSSGMEDLRSLLEDDKHHCFYYFSPCHSLIPLLFLFL
jgi:hypothetical protein